MITITVNDAGVRQMLASSDKAIRRAAELALDQTAKEVKVEMVKEMRKVFQTPTPYTLNSLQVTLTRGHNMKASVWFKDPDRMEDHYLVPQVEGGQRRLKGFERGAELGELVPARETNLDRYGNVPVRTIKAAMAGLHNGSRAYVVIDRHKTLPPGIYQRFKTTSGFGKRLRKAPLQRGRTRGRFSSAVLARGLKPVMVQGQQHGSVKPLLDFYGIARRTFDKEFTPRFYAAIDKQLSVIR